MSTLPEGLTPLPDRPVITLASLPRSPAMLTRREAAKVLGVPLYTVKTLTESGRLKCKWHTKTRCTIAWDWLIEYAAANNGPIRYRRRKAK